MTTPIPSLLVPSSPDTTKRKRSDSALEIFSLSPPYDTKRARIGIQELSTDPSPPTTSLALPLQSTLGDSPETQGSDPYISSDTDTESTSSSESDSSDEAGIDEGYDSDSESGSVSTSSSSSSSDESEHESTSRSASMGISSPAPPHVSLAPPHISVTSNANSLSSRLNAFLPALAAANAQLDEERKQGVLRKRDIEEVDENRYIEMNLGLGVLEEKKGSDGSGETGSSTDGANDGGDESDVVKKDGASTRDRSKRPMRRKKREVLARLMGKGKDRQVSRPSIEVMDGDG